MAAHDSQMLLSVSNIKVWKKGDVLRTSMNSDTYLVTRVYGRNTFFKRILGFLFIKIPSNCIKVKKL